MKSIKQLKNAEKIASQQQGLIPDLEHLVRDIDRCEKAIVQLKADLEQVTTKHAARKTTQEDVAYLEDLLACAKRKLVWEKQMASVQKRTPALMQKLESIVNHPESNPDEGTRNSLLASLKRVQEAMGRLQNAKF